MKWTLLPIALFLAGCGGQQTSRLASPEQLATPQAELPPMRLFTQTAPTAPQASNARIARDFLDLTFQLENGDPMPVFTRLEGPMTVRIIGKAQPTLSADLDKLIGRLRREAGLPISRVTSDEPATITVEAMPRRQIQGVAPTAACFVRPNVSSWDEYRARRNDPKTFWNRLTERNSFAVFLPNDVSPQEARDCLHEEIAQGLGPVNDIYRLNTSVFNDDNFHTVLTGYDMLILRAAYDPALRTGMTRQQVAARVPEIIARMNPQGGPAGIAPPAPRLGAWDRAIGQAASPRSSATRRKAAAERAVGLAMAAGPSDPRLAFSYYLLGRNSLSTDPELALKSFLAAGTIYQSRPDARIQEAHVALQVAAFQLSAGRAEIAEQLINQNLATVRQAENASLLSLMLLVKSEALALQNRTAASAEARREALAWGRYGFGTDREVRARVSEILAISPRSRGGLQAPT
ncbi:MAG: DUF2927 domain-containing protein [Paracoccaceae bacterium]|nr:DUF2927 domain-containing protein [Paracoccaceae bacterium]